eukprot:4985789-Pyramimonas_sp.AAC.1
MDPPPPNLARTPRTLRGTMRSSTEGHSGIVSSTELLSPSSETFWHSLRTLRGPMGSFAEGPSGRIRMAPPPYISAYRFRKEVDMKRLRSGLGPSKAYSLARSSPLFSLSLIHTVVLLLAPSVVSLALRCSQLQT